MLSIQCSREAQVWDSPYPLITLFCNGGNGDEVTGSSTPCCWEKTWLSEMNLSIKQQRLSAFIFSQTAIQALISSVSGRYLEMSILPCSGFLQASLWTIWSDLLGSVKKDRNGDQPCDSTELSMSSQRAPGAVIKSVQSDHLGPSNSDLEAK